MSVVLVIHRSGTATVGGELGFNWLSLAQLVPTGIASVGMVQQLQHANQAQAQQHGSGWIDTVFAQFHALEAAGATPAVLLQAMTNIRAGLDEPANGPWDSPSYHDQAIQSAEHELGILRSAPTAGQGTTTTVDPVTGQTVTVSTPAAASTQLISGIDNSTLLLAAVGVAAVLAFR